MQRLRRTALAVAALLFACAPAWALSYFATSQASVGTTSTQPIVAARKRRLGAVTIVNTGTTAVYIGNSTAVTATTGVLLPGTVGASITIPGDAAVYGVTSTGTATVSTLETY